MTSDSHRFARTLRKNSTAAETILWERLRGSRFHGAKFRRQVPFAGFVVDFYCHAAKLVIEIDGKQHDWFTEYDAERTRALERAGLHVMRLANAEVLGDLDDVLARIRAELRLPFT